MLKTILAVGCGSFLGGTGRYLISLALKGAGKGFPWATLAANVLGCLLIGVFWGLFSKNPGSNLALFLTVGFCGGFTTFSTFSKEALMMLQTGNWWGFTAYTGISIAAGIAAVAAGYHFLVSR